jgi:uncharacterized membrane protein YgdD (TMEM256/DUF423 family)
MYSKYARWGAVLAGVAVLLGAFGAHILKERLEPEQVAVFQTGVQYQFIHAIGLMLVALFYRYRPLKHMKNAGLAFLLGIGLFSGSLYLITLGHFTHFNFKWLGPITPIGGVAFVVGWGLVAAAFWAKK